MAMLGEHIRTDGAATQGFRLMVAPDEVAVHTDTVIPPVSTTLVDVKVPASLSELRNGHPVRKGASMRSRGAQVGLNCSPAIARTLFRANQLHEVIATVPIINHSQRPVALTPDVPIVVPYATSGHQFLSGPDLVRRVDSGDIGIIGKNGHDWDFWNNRDGQSNPREAEGIEFYINRDSRTWTPPHPNNEPVTVPTGPHSNEFRAEMTEKGILVPVADVPPPDDYLCVSEGRAVLTLTNTLGIIPTHLDHFGTRSHSNSRKIYPGNTQKWPVRFEHPIESGKHPDSVVIYFAPVY
jgi:hypothetical protein